MTDTSPTELVVGRFAPSPSGNLHLGSLRTALAAWLFAKSAGGKIHYRVEDVDRQRAGSEIRDQQIQDLKDLDLEFDPFQGHPYVSQSAWYSRYEDAVKGMYAKLFACACSRKALAHARTGLGGADDFYPGLCQNKGLPLAPHYALRCTPTSKMYQICDLVLGEQVFYPLRDHGPFIVRRADGHFAYQLVVVLDDIFMGVNQIVRGRDILPATGPQLFLYDHFKKTPPTYAHIPLVLSKKTGKKFSKSEGALDYQGLLRRGATRMSILRFLSHSLGLTPHGVEIKGPMDLIRDFSARKIIRDDTFVDPENLCYWIGGTGPYKI